MELINSDKVCAEVKHPESGQKRISLTGKVINLAANIWFVALGSSKAEIVSNILRISAKSLNYPAASISPTDGILKWYLDTKSSAEYIIES